MMAQTLTNVARSCRLETWWLAAAWLGLKGSCLMSAGTLMVFAVVSVALIWKRLYSRELPFKEQMVPFSLLISIVLSSIGELFDACKDVMIAYSVCGGLQQLAHCHS
jgi:hypothetical protein